MPRAGPDDVKAIIEVDPEIDVTAFLTAAEVVVDEVSACSVRRKKTLSVPQLRTIEAWLAAHFYAHRDQLFQSAGKGRSNSTFQGQTGMYLESTQYGQTAMVLDTSGCLRAINKGARPGVAWLGRAPSAQTNYVDRD